MLAENLSDVFQRGLEFGYDYENQLVKGLPKISESVSSPELKGLLERRTESAKRHIAIIEKIFGALHRATAGQANRSVSSILAESEKLIGHIDKSPLLDASLAITTNLVAHNGEGLYQSLAGMARTLNLNEIAQLIAELYAGEKACLSELEQIEPKVNQEAMGVLNSPHGFVII